ncbi:MAG TPA: ABC transporter ATP-binding protein, partial [Alcaligenes faecalis]|nr:ABC transporter ATP-binding protein [Alcaligenes faecalis]
EKIQILREAHAIQGLTDLELESPGLDELYAHFLKREDY